MSTSNLNSDAEGVSDLDLDFDVGGLGEEESPSISSPGVKKKNEDNEKELAAVLHSSDPHVIETQRRVTSIFGVFDRNSQKIIDVRDVGCIIRSLGLYPTESDVHEIIQAVEEPTPQGFAKYERFVPYVVKILLDGTRFQRPSAARVKKAFMTLDREQQGQLDPNQLKDVLMRQGEKFSLEEAEKFLKFTVNPDDNKVHWEVYLQNLNII